MIGLEGCQPQVVQLGIGMRRGKSLATDGDDWMSSLGSRQRDTLAIHHLLNRRPQLVARRFLETVVDMKHNLIPPRAQMKQHLLVAMQATVAVEVLPEQGTVQIRAGSIAGSDVDKHILVAWRIDLLHEIVGLERTGVDCLLSTSGQSPLQIAARGTCTVLL